MADWDEIFLKNFGLEDLQNKIAPVDGVGVEIWPKIRIYGHTIWPEWGNMNGNGNWKENMGIETSIKMKKKK